MILDKFNVSLVIILVSHVKETKEIIACRAQMLLFHKDFQISPILDNAYVLMDIMMIKLTKTANPVIIHVMPAIGIHLTTALNVLKIVLDNKTLIPTDNVYAYNITMTTEKIKFVHNAIIHVLLV